MEQIKARVNPLGLAGGTFVDILNDGMVEVPRGELGLCQGEGGLLPRMEDSSKCLSKCCSNIIHFNTCGVGC